MVLNSLKSDKHMGSYERLNTERFEHMGSYERLNIIFSEWRLGFFFCSAPHTRSGKEKRAKSIFENLKALCSNAHIFSCFRVILILLTPSESAIHALSVGYICIKIR